jgi:GTPase SAR1 family protein
MAFIDFNWLSSDVGKLILQSVQHNNKIKKFGLLERPSLPTSYSHFEEMKYKIMLMGKSNSGKTSFIESLCRSNEAFNGNYGETPGIHITNVYWPIKLVNIEKFIMFNLAFWDVGKLCSTKYDYIIPSCRENLDCIIFVFSWTDVQSFYEIVDHVKQMDNNNGHNQIAKFVIGTKFDEIAHSDIRPEVIEQFENEYNLRVVRFSSLNVDFDNICEILNEISELLWVRDQGFARVHDKK